MRNAADERAKEISWVRSVTKIVAAMPKKDFSPETRTTIDMVGHIACDPAVAASGNDLLLVSEDMGFRTWSAAIFGVLTTWLQPVMMKALSERILTTDQYCEATNTLVLSGHTYISLDSNCLMHQARKGNFASTDELSRLLATVGGPTADLGSNVKVLTAFIDALWQNCSDELKIKRIVSEAFYAITKGRQEDQRLIIGSILKQLQTNRKLVSDHALGWLIGHSIGMPYFNDLLQKQKHF